MNTCSVYLNFICVIKDKWHCAILWFWPVVVGLKTEHFHFLRILDFLSIFQYYTNKQHLSTVIVWCTVGKLNKSAYKLGFIHFSLSFQVIAKNKEPIRKYHIIMLACFTRLSLFTWPIVLLLAHIINWPESCVSIHIYAQLMQFMFSNGGILAGAVSYWTSNITRQRLSEAYRKL